MCEGFAKESGAQITVTEDIDTAVRGVDFVAYRCLGFNGRTIRRLGRAH